MSCYEPLCAAIATSFIHAITQLLALDSDETKKHSLDYFSSLQSLTTSTIIMAVESKYEPKDMVHLIPATSPTYFSNSQNPQIFRHLGPTGLKVSLFSLGGSCIRSIHPGVRVGTDLARNRGLAHVWWDPEGEYRQGVLADGLGSWDQYF